MSQSATPLNPLDPALRPLLDKQYAAFYDKHLANAPLPHQIPWDPSIRDTPAVIGGAEPLTGCETKDITLETCTIRIFYPPSRAPDLPALIWYHGGGMVLGSLDTDNAFCTRVATTAGCAVIAVDYRLAPEHPFPAGHDDAWSALQYVYSNAGELGIDPKRVAVGGTSSGGNLAACVAIRAGKAIPLQFVVLGVPVCDNTSTGETYPSWAEMENAPGLPAAKMMWYRNAYLPNPADWSNPTASPLLASDADLRASPEKYYISTAGMDILSSEGDAYAARLAALGKDITHRSYAGLPHAVQGMDGVLDAARLYVRDMCIYISEQFGGHAADCELNALYPLGPEIGVPREVVEGAWVKMPRPMMLGEAPIYRPEDRTLHFVDFEGSPPALNILPLDEAGDALAGMRTVELTDSVSVACFREEKPGYICAYERGVAFMDEDGVLEKIKEIIPEEDKDVLRLNDGAIDVGGRFWMTEIDIPALGLGTGRVPEGQVCRGRLWRYDPDGSLHLMDEDYSCGNGVCWNPENTIMYVNDSRGKTYAFDYDATTGNIANKRVLIDHRVFGGEPDGMVVDVNGDLWIAGWGTYCLMHYSADGKHIKDVRLGAKDIACPTFGGPNNDIIYVTTATDLRPGSKDSDLGGHLFRYRAGVKGLPKYRFKG